VPVENAIEWRTDRAYDRPGIPELQIDPGAAEFVELNEL
jgi:hypothetical protein